MASSKTEAAPPCGPALRALLNASALEPVAGNTPFLLDAPDRCWWLESGCIELFVVHADVDQGAGVRRHFASVQAGSLLLGVGRASALGQGGQYTLLAVPHVNSAVRPLARGQIEALAGDAGTLAAVIDRWVGVLLQALARWVVPAPMIQQTLVFDKPCAVAAHRRVASADGILWLDVPADAALFLGTEDIAGSGAVGSVALSDVAWLLTGRALELRGRRTQSLLDEGRLWAGLDALHRLLLPAAQLNLVLTEVDERQRLQRRGESARRDWRQGLWLLQDVLEPVAPQEQVLQSGTSVLVRAMQAVAQAEGFALRLPRGHGSDGAGAVPDLRAILQASDVRGRQVMLTLGWERSDTQAMLGFASDDGRPLAILPRAGRRIEVLDAQHQRIVRGAQALGMLAPGAWVFTAPLPTQPLDWRVLPRFTLARGWRDLLAVLLSALCGGLLGMAVPIGSSYLIDTVIPAHERGYLLQVGLILVALALASFVMTYVGSLAFSRFEARAGSALQAAIIDRLLRLPTGFFRDYTAGDLALRAGAITRIEQLISGSASQALLGGVFAVFSFGLLLYYDWRLGLWAVLLTVIFAALSLLLLWLQLRQERQQAHLEGRLQGLVLQLVTGMAKLRLSASEDRAFARWTHLFAQDRRVSLAAASYGNLQAVLNALFGLGPLILFFLILGKFRDPSEVGALTVGALAAFLAAFNNFKGSVTQMLHTLVGLLAVQPLLERAMPILTAQPEASAEREDPGELAGAVDFSHLSFRYQADGPLVLDDLTLSVRAGEFVAIVGASGCGKSTLVRLLLGFEPVQAGAILLDGKDMAELDVLAVRRQMGVVLQNTRPLPGSLIENIVGATDASLQDAWDAARAAGLAQDIEQMPMGMHTMVSEGGGLSGGQMQRLMIARAIVGKPRILVLDEATSALDNRVQAVITDSLERLSVTRIVVAHRLSTVTRADRIYVMDAGRVVEQGSYEELMRQGGHFARLAAAQLA